MNSLFELNPETYKISIANEALLLKPYKAIWTRDRSKNKVRAINELAYVWFWCDPRSVYKETLDEKTKSENILENLELPPKWKPDQKVEEAITYHSSFRSVYEDLFEDAMAAARTMSDYIRNIDPEETDKAGKPKYNPKQLAETITLMPGIFSDLQAAQEKMLQQLDESRSEDSVFINGI